MGKRSSAIAVLRFFRQESKAHMRARIKRELRSFSQPFRWSLWQIEGNRKGR